MTHLRTHVVAVLACTLLAVGPVRAAEPGAWVPARWQGGPVEVERRARAGTLPDAPALREAIRQWYDLTTLDLLQGTPINCVLITWSAGGSAEAEREQRKLAGAYARVARERGIAVLGLVHGPAVPESLIDSASEAGLNGLVLEGEFAERESLASTLRETIRKRGAALVVISIASPGRIAAGSDVLAVSDAVAAGVRDLGPEAEASPSSEPWIDFNLWLVQSIRAVEGSRPVWLMNTVPAQPAPADYLRAISDAAAAGGRWVIALDDELRHGLQSKQSSAIATWRQIADHLSFVQGHAEWYRYAPLATAAFVQDSAGDDADASGTDLRLAVRARIPLKVIERSRLTASALAGVRAVHAVDLVRPTEAERAVLTGFVQAGGLVAVGPSWQKVEFPEHQDSVVVPTGKGRVAVFREGVDPSELAKSLVDLIGRDNLGVRLFRAPSVLHHVSIGPAGTDLLVHLINYASYPAESVLVRVHGDFQRVRLHLPGAAPEELQIERDGGRVEVTVGKLAVYGVLRFER